ncbi:MULTISPECIES: type II secretion system protein [unclassified Mesotoga]|uniref:type II secretion system protein n=1 Tax=unclassified Mesotoga TaxID=1184398 RepID=UPI000DA691E1|nr:MULTISPECIES: type II secretion system protein [unclassified Mesotoga]PZC53085.1 N-terminal cleavage protein [Mesotoga sp. TolDC]
MKNRKRGFSLVELLIVLAVIAALIATITPVALNAIQKAKATKVGQNIKTLASAFENYVYVSGEVPANLTDIGRDIDGGAYAVYYDKDDTSGTYTVVVKTSEEANQEILEGVLIDVEPSDFTTDGYTALTDNFTGTVQYHYVFNFTNY